MRKFLTIFLAVMALSLPVSAATVDEAKSFVDNVGSQTLNILKVESAKTAKQAKLRTLFSDNVDIPWVGRFVLGRYWRQADETQKERYIGEYREFLLEHYAGRFAEYSGGSYKITDAKQDGDKFRVSMKINVPDQPNPVTVEYRLHDSKDGALKIYDVVVEGVSMITTQRSEFSSVAGRKGLDYLIERLASKSIALPEAGKKKS